MARASSSLHALPAQAATEVRKEVNKLDNLTTGKAVDALLNFETVALFNNQVFSGALSPKCSPQASELRVHFCRGG